MKKQEKEPFLDRVLLHSKNADERLFDMVLRFITFVILIIIIWIYADLAHARADSLTLAQYYNIDFDKLNVSSASSLLWRADEYSYCLSNYTDIPFNSNYHPNYITTGYTTNHIMNDGMFIDGNYQFYCYAGAGLDGWYVYSIDKDLIDSGHVIYTQNGFYSDIDFTYNHGSVWGNTVYPVTDYTATFDHTLGVHHLSNDQYCSTATCYFSNCPCWAGSRLDVNVIGGPINWTAIQEDIVNNNLDTDSDALFNCNYFLYDNILRNPWDDNTPKESNLNHLYLTDAQVGLSAPNNKTELINSSVVIGVGADDWVINHPDNFYLQITYEFEIHGTIDGATMATTVQPYTQTLPIRTFFNDIYTYGIPQLNRDTNLNYDGLSSYGIRIVSANNYNGVFPMARRAGEDLSKLISDAWQYIYEPPYPQQHEIVFTQFDLSVRLLLVDTSHQGGNVSGDFVKVFDFLNGTESIKSAKIFQNQNPWTGDPNTDPSPYVPSDGTGTGSATGGASARATVGNITITTGNGYQDTELHRLTDQDIAHNHQKIITVIEDLKYCFHQFAQESNHNSFIQMIYDDYNYIPGIEYITTSIIIICGVCVLIFIIKIAF